MDRNWKRLGLAIRATREAAGMLQTDLADAAGINRQTIVALEKGTERRQMPKSIGAVEKALGWPPGRAGQILAESDPADSGEGGTPPSYAQGMPQRVAQELSEGQVVDTEVIDLTLPGSNSRLVVVLKHDSPAADMSPEELRAMVEEWTRYQRAMRQVSFDPRPESEADEA